MRKVIPPSSLDPSLPAPETWSLFGHVHPVEAKALYWMDDCADGRQICAMPTSIKKLNDAFADYSLRIRCKKCQHERITEPHALARIAGWTAELKALELRMRCSRCHARGQCELVAFTQGRPRGYHSH